MARSSQALQALTAAAVALPGLTAVPSAAQDNAAELQFGRYQESRRDLFGLSSKFDPLRSDALLASVRADLPDRWSGVLNLRQDTWSGATPIATAPREWRGNRSRALDGVSGATPYINMSNPLFLDRRTQAPLRTDGFGNLTGGSDTQNVHTIAGASRETRRQVDFNARRPWDDAALTLNAGVSSEPDYLSRFAGAGGQWDFNQKLTTASAGVAYARSDINATLDHDALPYIFNACGTAACNFVSSSSRMASTDGGGKVIQGERRDVSFTAGLTQVLSANAQVQANVAFTRSSGYLSNPYKVVEVAFIDPAQQFLSPSPDIAYINVNAILENRPRLRKQWLFNVRYAQFVDPSEAGLHVNYAYFRDDWGIRAHTVELEWAQPLGADTLLTPTLRYYTQTAASFYVPYLVTDQGQHRSVTDPASGAAVQLPFDLSQLPTYYSSDYRLSAFGTLGGGFTLNKVLGRGVTAALGYAYFRHAGSLKWNGGGEGAFADFDWWLLNASLAFELDSAAAQGMVGHGAHVGVADDVPAGVQFGHLLPGGAFMASLRLVGTRQGGSFRAGTRQVDDAQLKAQACGSAGCLVAPSRISMSMYMLELMYAPTEWLTLMVMPTYVNMAMDSRGLLTAADEPQLSPDIQAIYTHHTSHEAQSGGIGDTGLYALLRLYDEGSTRAHVTLGVTLPTGESGLKLRDTHQIDAGYDHYGMQLGSGTWDFNPSVTIRHASGPWFFGAQASAVVRMQGANRAGYALGDVVQGTVWTGYAASNGLAATLRAVYTGQSAIRGEYNGTHYKLSPLDYPANYGGRFFDIGLGASYAFAGGLAGNRLAAEWLQPVRDDPNGCQLTRRGTLYASWQYHF